MELIARYNVDGAESEFKAVECALKAFQAELNRWEKRKTNKFKSWSIHVKQKLKKE